MTADWLCARQLFMPSLDKLHESEVNILRGAGEGVDESPILAEVAAFVRNFADVNKDYLCIGDFVTM